jgi:hypothetical protein
VWCLSLLVPVGQVDEYAWQELTLLKAVLLETQAKLLFCRTSFFKSCLHHCPVFETVYVRRAQQTKRAKVGDTNFELDK